MWKGGKNCPPPSLPLSNPVQFLLCCDFFLSEGTKRNRIWPPPFLKSAFHLTGSLVILVCHRTQSTSHSLTHKGLARWGLSARITSLDNGWQHFLPTSIYLCFHVHVYVAWQVVLEFAAQWFWAATWHANMENTVAWRWCLVAWLHSEHTCGSPMAFR